MRTVRFLVRSVQKFEKIRREKEKREGRAKVPRKRRGGGLFFFVPSSPFLFATSLFFSNSISTKTQVRQGAYVASLSSFFRSRARGDRRGRGGPRVGAREGRRRAEAGGRQRSVCRSMRHRRRRFEEARLFFSAPPPALAAQPLAFVLVARASVMWRARCSRLTPLQGGKAKG